MSTSSVANFTCRRSQQGVVLLVTLIMLGIFSIIVISMLSGSNTNFKIAGNQQFRMEAKLAARQAIETYISNPANFPPPEPYPNPVISVDINGDGVEDLNALLPEPECLRAIPLLNSELDPQIPSEQACMVSAQLEETSGNIGPGGSNSNPNSLCVKKTYDVVSTVEDVATGAAMEMHQGVYLRVPIGDSCD